MKRTLALTVVLSAAFALSAATPLSETIGDITWRFRIIDDVAEIWNNGATAVESEDPPILSLTLPQALGGYVVKGIGDGAFANLRGIGSISIPSTYESIGDYAFSNCTSLASITIPEGVRSIGKRPFVNTIIGEITLPNTLLNMDGNIAAGAPFDLDTALDDSSHFLVTEDGAVYNRDQTKLYACPTRTEGTLILPDSLTEIGADAFFGCFRLTYLNIPANVAEIESGAFNVSGIWPGLDAPESEAKLSQVLFDGLEPTAPDDIFGGSTGMSIFAYITKGWSGTEWKGQPLTLLKGDPEPTVLSQTIEGVTWRYVLAADGAQIVGAADATDNVVIPRSLDGKPVLSIEPAAFNGCSNITAFAVERGCVTFMAKNGALYSADGKTLIRVPDTYRLEATVTTQSRRLSITETVIPAINPDGTDGTRSTTNSVVKKTTTTSQKIPSTVPVATLLADVTTIADCAFTGCGIVEGMGTVVATNGTGTSQTGFIGKDVYVKTTYDVTESSSSYTEIVCVPETVSFGPNAFAGSGATSVLSTPVSSIRLTATASLPGKSVAIKDGSAIQAQVGAAFSLSLESLLPDGSSDATISVKGLPAGLKLVRHAEKGKVTYTIEGTATKPVNGQVVTLTAKKGSTLKGSMTFSLTTEAIPVEAVGSFSGFLVRSPDGVASDDIGTFTLTTTEAGKITAKVVTAGGSTSFTASRWDFIAPSGLCSARLTTRKGDVLDIAIDTTAAWDAMQVSGTFSSAAASGNITAQKNIFASTWYLTCHEDGNGGWILHAAKDSKSADLKVSLKANGATSVTGSVGAYRISSSGTVNVSTIRNGALAADFVTFVKVGKVKRALSVRTDMRFDHKDPPEGIGQAKLTADN